MTDISIAELTNKTKTVEGTGVFDLLNISIGLNLEDEYEKGRITGADYATVYLGALQSTLQQALTFLLSEQEASKKIDLLDQQIEEIKERIDLVIAQTAKAYEDVNSSKAKTNRENILNSKQVLLVEAQTADQTYITSNVRPAELLKISAEIALVDARKAEVLASTIRSDLESTQKIALMAAQTLGFASDTKQKLLKQMQDGFAVALSIAGVGNIPEANQDAAIDDLTQELLLDVSSTVTIGNETVVPVL